MERFQKNCFLKSLLLIFALVMFSASAFAQKSVTGKVVDEHGEGLPGVNVVEKVLQMVQSPTSMVFITLTSRTMPLLFSVLLVMMT